MSRTCFHLEDDERVAIPGNEVKVAAQPRGVPAAGYNRVPERPKVKPGEVLAALPGEQMRRFGVATMTFGICGGAPIRHGAQTQEDSLLQREEMLGGSHAARSILATGDR